MKGKNNGKISHKNKNITMKGTLNVIAGPTFSPIILLLEFPLPPCAPAEIFVGGGGQAQKRPTTCGKRPS